MSTAYATVDDVIALWRPLTADETARAEALLPLLSDELRVYARKVGKDLDAMVEADEAYEHETEVISDGYFHESEYRSAPYFNLNIDGINLLDTNFG